MPTYTYTCRTCGPFDLVRTISRRVEPANCPACQRQSMRVISAPHLSRLDSSLDRSVTSAGLSSESPGVTRHIPPALRSAPPPARRPGHPSLPRP
ncbi:zinc ribbon domain-containing protein [Aeromicrobium sp. YIM 150415]|uniref:FmdB family zinc ribbon protein n=1 Tax=Aeromicrobium sp. YIM 150415 TaxID=2803912 RepID=UPI0019648C3E|nr:zinc ribbon domain-containing protein [Aeromicrobium sp. YIM 150415]MBM9464728.1 zinc ribbon domain-containing protein [Aeromicrobium sp. YIM 150415]